MDFLEVGLSHDGQWSIEGVGRLRTWMCTWDNGSKTLTYVGRF